MDDTTRKNLNAIIRSLKRGKPMKNVCTGCGVSTDDDYCPNGCQSAVDPTQIKMTIPWAMIPTNCWDCGQAISTPPHMRRWQGMCSDCEAKALGKRN